MVEVARHCLFTLLVTLSASIAARQAAAQWPYHEQIGPFKVHADFPIDAVRPLFNDLDGLQRDIQKMLFVGPMREQVDVYLFARRDMYQQYLRYYFPGVGVREAMFIKSNSPGNVFAYVGPQFATDLRHESTHAILHAMLPIVPLWLDEGLAEYFELPADQRVDSNPYLASVARKAKFGLCPSLARLESLHDLSEFGPREYQESWAYVHLMLHGPEPAKRALLGYFNDVQRHQPPTAVSQRLDGALGDTKQAFVTHFRDWKR